MFCPVTPKTEKTTSRWAIGTQPEDRIGDPMEALKDLLPARFDSRRARVAFEGCFGPLLGNSMTASDGLVPVVTGPH